MWLRRSSKFKVLGLRVLYNKAKLWLIRFHAPPFPLKKAWMQY